MAASITRPRLSREQQAALDALANDMQRAFVFEIVMDPKANGTAAARAAGYKGDENVLAVQASRLLSEPKIQTAIALLRKPAMERKYRDAEGLREWWDANMDNDEWEPRDRVKCSDSLAKSQGVFVERHEVEIKGAPQDVASARALVDRLAADLGAKEEAIARLWEGADE